MITFEVQVGGDGRGRGHVVAARRSPIMRMSLVTWTPTKNSVYIILSRDLDPYPMEFETVIGGTIHFTNLILHLNCTRLGGRGDPYP